MRLAVALNPLPISIHALHEESDRTLNLVFDADWLISIHALHEESDRQLVEGIQEYGEFQSTLSMRRATYAQQSADWGYQFQSTLSMRRATAKSPQDQPPIRISIHALHEESDVG